MASEGRASGRSGGRAARRALRTREEIGMLPALERRIPPYEILDQEGLERIHLASMALLEQTGIEFRDPVALAQWREAGAEVDG